MSTAPATLTRNVTRTYRNATDAHRAHGATWYADARRTAASMLPPGEIYTARACAVVAALSPRLTWAGNVDAARLACQLWLMGHDRDYFVANVPTLKANALKAWRILEGEAPLDVLGGQKVRAFYACIVSAGEDPNAVCVDMHAHDIAVGRVTDDATRGTLSTLRGYGAIADAYRRAARILSREYGREISPCEVQAATWVAWRATTYAAHRSATRRAA